MEDSTVPAGGDRSLMMPIFPTSTGYVNYCVVAAAEYLTLGDIPTITLQYSKPSVSPVDRPHRRGPEAEPPPAAQRVGAATAPPRPTVGPRMVLFEESRGAHTSRTY